MGSRLRCSGCGQEPGSDDPYPFACPNAGVGDVDHVLVRHLTGQAIGPLGERTEPNPFVRYRQLLHSYHRAQAGGIGDDAFVALVRQLDQAVAKVDGHGFAETPFEYSAALSEALGFGSSGGIWVKDETGNVAGSHKARHLMGVLLHLEVSDMLGLARSGEEVVLAVASCGNAALAAGVLAAAARRPLRVFVPVDASPWIVERLTGLGSEVVVCERSPGEPGDPCYLALQQALLEGAVPFTCQGNLNGLAIEGGQTLGYEMATTMGADDLRMDHVIVQVGGGALASAVVHSLTEAVTFGAISGLPRIHTLQTDSAHPLERAYRRLVADLPPSFGPGEIDGALQQAARHRSAYMWPWEDEPKSIASGILDDETYDWLVVVGGMLRSGGVPVVAGEDLLSEAFDLGRQCEFEAEATGTAGLAGLMRLMDEGAIGLDDRVALLFTGVDRGSQS